MRVKDENKKEAIFEATIDLLNEIGFANISMSQIAKKANVSSSTLYIYFDNKEDMLRKVYRDVNEKLGDSICRNLDQTVPVRQVLGQIVRRILCFATEQPAYFMFLEQFSNAPMLNTSCEEDTANILTPVVNVLKRGQQEGILKKAHPGLLLTFCYFGTVQIAKYKVKANQVFSDAEVEELTQMWWDAIKS
jgi:AcrR family transcriptional regulator